MAITYDDLHRVLLTTGFVARGVQGAHHLFEHPATGPTFSLPLETRPPRGLATYSAGLQGLLDLAGILGRDEFVARVSTPPSKPKRRRPRRQPAAR
jgi:hypothetical protein